MNDENGERGRAEPSGTERGAAERSGTEHGAAERSGTERRTAERSGTEHSAAEPSETEHSAAEPSGTEPGAPAGGQAPLDPPKTVGAAAVRDARRWLSRRSVLIAGASGLAVAGLAAGTATGKLPFSQALQRALGVASSNPTTQLGSTRVERVYSAARGRMVDLVFVLPSKTPPRGLPMSLMLHGLHGNARSAVPTGTLKQLASDVARKAVPAFGFVAVDGGDNYWHEVHPGDDPMAMLLEEVPQWLRARGFAGPTGQPFACTGVSMGGFGALVYTRRRVERRQPPAAVATLAPALILSWQEMAKRHIFTGLQDWTSLDPLRHVDETKSVANGIWCGTEDPFITGVRRYIEAAHPAVAHTAHGKHGDPFNRTVVPSLISFLGKHVPRTD